MYEQCKEGQCLRPVCRVLEFPNGRFSVDKYSCPEHDKYGPVDPLGVGYVGCYGILACDRVSGKKKTFLPNK